MVSKSNQPAKSSLKDFIQSTVTDVLNSADINHLIMQQLNQALNRL